MGLLRIKPNKTETKDIGPVMNVRFMQYIWVNQERERH
ncbi:hypothetical protein B4133_1988 [Bacillus altitudinis]|nr:hypothetical protein B4133_1988 [Bacillus altitudinis]